MNPPPLLDPAAALALWNDSKSPLWNGWHEAWLDDEDAFKRVPLGSAGAYILGLGLGDKRSKALKRVCGTDPFGVLDIGESNRLRARLRRLGRCINGEGVHGHMAGWRYRYLNFQERLNGRLYLSWIIGEDSYAMEARLLRTYLSAFGELPPLNYKFNWSQGEGPNAVA